MPRSDIKVVLVQPGYGGVTAGASRAFWQASALPESQIDRQFQEGSLLAQNFNICWARALNLAHKGKRIDYFAMIHADVEPEDEWLDVLIDELEASNLDLLSVVVPIKDERGVTSIALDRPDGDTWRPLCRLTMAEVMRLPPTFTSEDVGYPILVNTGLWVCRFDLAWARKVRFTINDRIVFDQGSDRYLAQCEPEDWYFSRLCHEIKLRIGATRKVRLTHRGPAQFYNDRVWGEPYDSAWIGRSPLCHDADHFVLPDISGWLRYEEGKELARLARGKRVLEIGPYLGLSTVCMAREALSVTTIDTFDGRATPTPQSTFQGLVANLERFGVRDRVKIRHARMPLRGEYDMAFIDADHSREAVEADIVRALGVLRPGGVAVFHDYCSSHPGVVEAVDALISRGGEMVSVTSSLAVVRPPAAVLQEV
jgi:hypothetical protein